MDITQLLAFSVKNKASDLHLSAGLPPMIRVHGDVRRINVDPLEHKQVHDMVYDIMNDSQRKAYEETLECDFSFEIQGLALDTLSMGMSADLEAAILEGSTMVRVGSAIFGARG